MPVHADKAGAKQPKQAARATGDTAPALADDRPATVAQRRLHAALDASPQVARLHDVAQLIGAAPHVRRLEAMQPAQPTASGIPVDQPVQRVVRWNQVRYGAEQASLLRRKLRTAGVDADRVETIVAQAALPRTYIYTGNDPVLQNPLPPPAPLPLPPVPQVVAPQDNAVPAPLPLAQGGPDVLADQPPPVPVVAHDAPVIAPDVQQDAPPIVVDPGPQQDAPAPLPVAQDAVPVVDNAVPPPLLAPPPGPLLAQPGPAVAPVVPAHPVGRHQSNVPLGRLAYNHDLDNLRPYLGARSLAAYRLAYIARTAAVNRLDDPGLTANTRLYHATPIATARLIRDSALGPKEPAWGGGASASKDNYLSFARSEANANALGGVAIVLRVILDNDEIGPGKWRRASGSEVLTTQTFQPDRLDWTRKGQPLNWQPLNTLPDPA